MCRSVGNVGDEDSSIDSPSQQCSPSFGSNNGITPVYSFSPRQMSNTNLSQQQRKNNNSDLPDYDDLPSDHKPILPPKTGNQSTSHLSAIDPIQLALHNQIMSRSVGNIITSPIQSSTPNPNYFTLQTKKHPQNTIEESARTASINGKSFQNGCVPLPSKTNPRKNKLIDTEIDNKDSKNKTEEFEDYDQPVVKHQKTLNHESEEYEDYDEPVIKHSLASASARTEFEDYDEPINHAKFAPRHKRFQ